MSNFLDNYYGGFGNDSSDDRSKLMDEMIIEFFIFQITLKLFHFQTKSYASHKTSDKYLSIFLDKFDKFFEVFQGISGKTEINKKNIVIITQNDNNISKYAENFVDKLIDYKKLINTKIKKSDDLLNILDEIIGDTQQFIYLLTFK